MEYGYNKTRVIGLIVQLHPYTQIIFFSYFDNIVSVSLLLRTNHYIDNTIITYGDHIIRRQPGMKNNHPPPRVFLCMVRHCCAPIYGGLWWNKTSTEKNDWGTKLPLIILCRNFRMSLFNQGGSRNGAVQCAVHNNRVLTVASEDISLNRRGRRRI